jgi:hypothetical protein
MSQGGEGLKDAGQHTRGHVPSERLEVLHLGDSLGYEGTEHLAALPIHGVLGNPIRRAVAQGELARVLSIVGFEEFRGGRSVRADEPVHGLGKGASYAEGGQAVGEGIDAGRVARGGIGGRPYYVEARVYLRNGKTIECRVGPCKGGQVAGSRDLKVREERLEEEICGSKHRTHDMPH